MNNTALSFTRSRVVRLSTVSRLCLVGCALALAGSATACDSDEPRPANPAVESGLQQVVDQAIAKPDIVLPGAIVHYRDPGYAAWTGSAGVGDVSAKTPMGAQDQIRAGSVLKTFLSTITLQHVEEGTLSLDQPLTALLPTTVTDRVANAEQITLRMLLNHTSGIPEWVTPDVDAAVAADPARIWSEDEIISLSARVPPWFPPGTSWRYSNTNYTLVGLILDRAGGKSWREQVRERVFAPLGLTSSHLPEPGDHQLTGPVAHGYQPVNGSLIDLTATDSSMAGAAGGNALLTTTQDLARFLDALLAGRLFRHPETLAAMKTMVEAPNEAGLPHRYGLGLESYDLPSGVSVLGNSGGAAGYTVMMYQLTGTQTILVTATNTSDLFTNALDVFIPASGVVKMSVASR